MIIRNIKRIKPIKIWFYFFRSIRRELNYIDKDINNYIEEQNYENKYVINVFVDIFATNLYTQEKAEIGKLTGNFFESEIINENQ